MFMATLTLGFVRSLLLVSATGGLVLVAGCGEDAPLQGDLPFVPSTGNITGDAGATPVVGNPDAGSGGPFAPPLNPPVDSGTPAETGGDAAVDAGEEEPDVGIGLEGTGLTPFPTSGEPLSAPPLTWTYVEFPETSCRDGSKAGLALSLNPDSTKVMIFFEGGGACFDGTTCAANPANVGNQKSEKTTGVFDRTNDQNPFKDWNFVYLPYCTGDVFAGTNENGSVDGQPQRFVGYLNTQKFLDRLVPTFPDATDVVVTGISAGGFGASASVVLIQRAFHHVRGKLINDSGPPMAGEYLAPCLQQKWRDTWGLAGSMLADCGAGCPDHDDYTADYGYFLAETFQDRLSGMIEATRDGIISGFFGAGEEFLGGGPCSGIPILTPVPGEKFERGLLAFRESVSAFSNFGTYFPTGTTHTWLSSARFYEHAIGDTTMVEWVSDIVNDVGTTHVGP
jgi:hypothetical protein